MKNLESRAKTSLIGKDHIGPVGCILAVSLLFGYAVINEYGSLGAAYSHIKETTKYELKVASEAPWHFLSP